jgi:hypothetical protein
MHHIKDDLGNEIPIPDGLTKSQILCYMRFGSHLYGTDGPDSDTDYKGVYMPRKEDLLLQAVPKSISYKPNKGEGVKNTKDDVDIEVYSLHYFLELAKKGETVAIDMLHAPLSWLNISSEVWADLHNNRSRFHTKNLKAFVGYARKQAAKYGIKGSRLNAARKVMDYLAPMLQGPDDPGKLLHHWENLPTGEHIHRDMSAMIGDIMNNTRPGVYQVCGKQIQSTVKVQYAYDIVKKFYDQYGARAKQAADNKGIDWKAVSHALRAAYEVESILKTGDIEFPLKPAGFIKRVKDGKIHWNLVQRVLEILMEDLEEDSEKSTLPDRVNVQWVQWWLLDKLTGGSDD